jgi:hypothetical protein
MFLQQRKGGRKSTFQAEDSLSERLQEEQEAKEEKRTAWGWKGFPNCSVLLSIKIKVERHGTGEADKKQGLPG